jgi:hypothetical protein
LQIIEVLSGKFTLSVIKYYKIMELNINKIISIIVKQGTHSMGWEASEFCSQVRVLCTLHVQKCTLGGRFGV